MVTRLAWNLQEVAEMLGISKGLMYRLSKSNEFPLTKIGGKTVVLDSDLQDYLDSRSRS